MTIGNNGKSRDDSYEISISQVDQEPVGSRELNFFALFGFRTNIQNDELSFDEAINEAPLDFAAIEKAIDEAMRETGLALSAEFGEQIPFIIATDKTGAPKTFGPDGRTLPCSGGVGDVAIEAMEHIGHLYHVDSDGEFTERLKMLFTFYQEHLLRLPKIVN